MREAVLAGEAQEMAPVSAAVAETPGATGPAMAEAPGMPEAPGEAPAAMAMMDDRAVRARVADLEGRLGALEALDPVARSLALAAVQGLATLYGEGLARIVGWLEASALSVATQQRGSFGGEAEAGFGAGSASVRRGLDALLDDELITHLLILHDLHPLDLPARVERALDETRPYLRSHGGDAEVVRIEGGVVQIRMIGSCHGCPSSALTLRDAVEEAVRRLAPEIERVEEVGSDTELVQLERRGA